MLSKKLIKSLVTPGKDEVCQAGAEKRPRTIICQAAEDDACKGSRHERKVQFFLTLFKRPLTPPLSFEHHVVNFLKEFQQKSVNACRNNY